MSAASWSTPPLGMSAANMECAQTRGVATRARAWQALSRTPMAPAQSVPMAALLGSAMRLVYEPASFSVRVFRGLFAAASSFFAEGHSLAPYVSLSLPPVAAWCGVRTSETQITTGAQLYASRPSMDEQCPLSLAATQASCYCGGGERKQAGTSKLSEPSVLQ